MSHLALIGNQSLYSITIFFGLILGFFAMTYEEYKLGELHFPIVNATDEGNITFCFIAVLCGFVGQKWLNFRIFGNFTLGNFFGLFCVFGGFTCVYNLCNHTLKKKRIKGSYKNFLRLDLFLFSFIISYYLCLIF